MTAAFLTLALASTASADVTRSQITSPGDPYFDVANDANATENVTVRGTTDGGAGDTVDLICYGSDNTQSPSPGQDIAVDADGTFQGQVDLFDLSDNGYGCTLRAVPDGAFPDDTSPFRGARMLITYFEPPSTGGTYPVHNGGTVEHNVYGDLQFLRGSWFIYEVDDDPLYDSGPVNPRNLFNNQDYNGYYPVEYGADWEDTNQEGDKAALQVDGQNAYTLNNLRQLDYDQGGPEGPTYPDNVQSIQASISQDGDGNVTIVERYPLYYCEDNSVFPPTDTSCDTVSSAGVRVDREKKTSDGGATMSVTDTFVSTDGDSHDVDAEYYDAAGNDYNYPEYLLPGGDGYSMWETGDTFEWPGSPVSMVWRDNTGAGGGYTGAGAKTHMRQPANSTWDDYDDWYTRYRDLSVPAGGSNAIQQHYHVAFTSDEAEDLAAARRDPLSPPVVTITGPAEGSVIGSDSVNVIGTASDDTEVTSLNVNGIPTGINPDGTFAQRISLVPGPNALTATATDRSGNETQSTVNVTYDPGAPPAPPAAAPPPAGRGVSAVQLRTRRLRLRRTLRLRVRCTAAAQNGTLELRTSKRPRRILGQKAFQCPAGGTRTVAFRLSKRRVRELRRKGRQRLVVDIVGRDLAGEAGIFRSRFTLLMPIRRARRG